MPWLPLRCAAASGAVVRNGCCSAAILLQTRRVRGVGLRGSLVWHSLSVCVLVCCGTDVTMAGLSLRVGETFGVRPCVCLCQGYFRQSVVCCEVGLSPRGSLSGISSAQWGVCVCVRAQAGETEGVLWVFVRDVPSAGSCWSVMHVCFCRRQKKQITTRGTNYSRTYHGERRASKTHP
jgi:hypothetical protein